MPSRSPKVRGYVQAELLESVSHRTFLPRIPPKERTKTVLFSEIRRRKKRRPSTLKTLTSSRYVHFRKPRRLDCLARFDRRRRRPVAVVCAFYATFTGWVSRIMNLTKDERKVLMRTI